MKKNTLLLALGQKPEDEETDDELPEAEEDEAEPDPEETVAEEDEAIDAALDPDSDPETRRAAFRRAVELCMKSGY